MRRDYEMFAYCTADPQTGVAPEHLRYLFKLCVVAETETAISEEIWSRSPDGRLIDYDQGKDLDRYVWGTQWQVLYPGDMIIEESTGASHWTSALERNSQEVRVETNGHNLTLIFSELEVTQVEPGYSPFTVPPAGLTSSIHFSEPPPQYAGSVTIVGLPFGQRIIRFLCEGVVRHVWVYESAERGLSAPS